MNTNLFTVEEENLICAFDASSRAALINEINAVLHDFEEPDMREIAENVLIILNKMADEEFSGLTFNPAYYNEDDDETEV